MADDQHPDEEVVDALKEQFFIDLGILVDWSKAPGGRPMFQRYLSDSEKFMNFTDPNSYGATLSRLDYLEKLGLEPKGAMLRYVKDMMQLAHKLAEAPRG